MLAFLLFVGIDLVPTKVWWYQQPYNTNKYIWIQVDLPGRSRTTKSPQS